jgi:hypothetical protein
MVLIVKLQINKAKQLYCLRRMSACKVRRINGKSCHSLKFWSEWNLCWLWGGGGDGFLVVIFKRFVRKSNISRHERTLACFYKKCQFCYFMSGEMCEFKDVQMVNEVRTNSSVLVDITCTSFKWRLPSAYEECQCHSLGHCGWQVQFIWQFWL